MAMNEKLVVPLPMTVSASSSVTNPGNVTGDRLGRVANFTGAGGYVVLDLGSALSVDTIAILATNGVAGGTFTARAFPTSADAVALTAQIYTSGARGILASGEGAKRLHRQGLLMMTDVTARFWRIDFTTMTVGKIVIGDSFTALDTADVGYSFKVVDLGQARRSSFGLEDPQIRGKVLEYSWTWSWMTEAEARGALLDVLAYAGLTRDVLMIFNPDAADLHNVIGFGKLQEEVEGVNVAGGIGNGLVNAYQARFRLQSRLLLTL